MKTLHNEIIRASAGSGKTWRLVRRYLWLLANGAEPERIAAMTFTRKAAGEFFERILLELAEIATKPSRAKGYVDELDGELALKLLRKMLQRMDRLQLGTIDSFFATMAQCLPFELGLTGQGALMGEEDAKQAREDVLDELLLTVTRMPQKGALDELREAWKDASHGSEQNKPADTLLNWIGQLHNLFVECPDRIRWGGVEAVWPGGNDKFALADADMSELVAKLEGALDMSAFDKRAPEKWEKFFDEALSRNDADKLNDKAVEYMLKDERRGHAQLRLGGAEWLMWKSTKLDMKSGTALADVLDAIVARILRVRVRRTSAQFDVMRLYEGIYHRLVRSLGRLVFSDLGWLLSGRLRAARVSAEEWREQWEQMRTMLEFRMDSRFDHWLLDEFQDTSERQWEVLAPLLEEARQDAEGSRSVFLVGDLKQSIYLWRQAEPELFKHVERAWDDGRLMLHPLNESFRSCPAVLAMVNAIFMGADAELNTRFPGVDKLWSFDEHRCSEKVGALLGHAAFLCLPKDDEAEEESDESATSALIRKIQPLARNLTCGVLVRKNETARAFAAELRRQLHGMDVICESMEAVTVDNPATLALLSLFQLAAHPGDSRAWKHLLMTPLGEKLRAEKMTAGRLSALVRGSVAANGFLHVAREWADNLKAVLTECDDFTERRFAQFFELAAQFDETGSRDGDAFLQRARDHKVREVSARTNAIQVMTVHQSKGLEFDVVIMPELQGDALDNVARNRLFVARSGRGQVDWILDKPETTVAKRDETLNHALCQEKARAAFEGLCRLYVGATRARLGLYLVISASAKNFTNNEADILRARLGAESLGAHELDGLKCDSLWESGDRAWFEKYKLLPPQIEPTVAGASDAELGARLREVNRSIARRTPSGEESFCIKGSDLLSPGREQGRKMGLLVHELFASVEWFDGDLAALEQRWKLDGWSRDPGYVEAAKLVAKVLQEKETRAWFQQTSAARSVWVERKFDMLHDGDWISGEPDRVVLERDAKGGWKSAVILDFKTDSVSDEASIAAKAKGYASQLALYKMAISRLTGLGAADIRTALIFTDGALLRWVETKCYTAN